jgi:hypothetical protein
MSSLPDTQLEELLQKRNALLRQLNGDGGSHSEKNAIEIDALEQQQQQQVAGVSGEEEEERDKESEV